MKVKGSRLGVCWEIRWGEGGLGEWTRSARALLYLKFTVRSLSNTRRERGLCVTLEVLRQVA